MKKQITVTMTFIENENYPSDDPEALVQNVFSLLNSRLVCSPLTDKLKNMGNTKLNDKALIALNNVLDNQHAMAQEMIKSLKVTVK